MMIVTTRFSRKKAVLAVVLLGALLCGLILLLGREPAEAPQPLSLLTNDDRLAFLSDCGWEADPEPVETLQFLLPDPLTGEYADYNRLQLAQGFDLTPYCGQQVTRYTYAVTNYPTGGEVQANLYIWEDQPIAGDLCRSGTGSFQLPLLTSAE